MKEFAITQIMLVEFAEDPAVQAKHVEEWYAALEQQGFNTEGLTPHVTVHKDYWDSILQALQQEPGNEDYRILRVGGMVPVGA